MKKIEGIIPVMLTPFTDDNVVDYPGLGNLIDWYIANGADALFAVCQSSEMQFLTLEERVELAKFVVDYTQKRIPVIASGHISDDLDAQIAELSAMAQTGIDALVLVTNHLDPENQGTDAFKHHLDAILAALPSSMALGLYECPAPYRRLLSDEELMYCAASGRFRVLKDVSCDLPTVIRRVELVKETPMAIVNANAAIAWEAMQAGSKGFCGVFTNFHPDLYHWLYHHGAQHRDAAEPLAWFLSLSAVTETIGYPKNAKIFHQKRGTFASVHCRVTADDVLKKYWGLEVILQQIADSGEWQRKQLADLPK
ncbi:dihydrodipicolinate synthase family protein [Klebsiella spallanzanii]|jgi:4-hydroxy-tetrahydrodipicolinate synthase|uniref:4-hydroxy-tetrahydrodipicolinate synthase n=1 Tax=Klebsiella spallanzanii TaxID=2587528 RepID=A0A564KIR5_9ENTR|nr:dihydrodipicolinate synthase family protein [Klebsiella spallanzanii]VUS69170.1 4-hydroxy-tetrahydrodipicolinate synthase [Klebsiella spallanzanii]VUT10395.1 4-hydroxy-tetrahydrodipicolinate synthase [Klebsiella spallanzanii]